MIEDVDLDFLHEAAVNAQGKAAVWQAREIALALKKAGFIKRFGITKRQGSYFMLTEDEDDWSLINGVLDLFEDFGINVRNSPNFYWLTPDDLRDGG